MNAQQQVADLEKEISKDPGPVGLNSTPAPARMRFNVGDVVAAIGYSIQYPNGNKSEGGAYSKFIPWSDKLLMLDVIKLTCTGHHKVPGDYDDVIQYDGFIFTTDDGKIYTNQIPRASYGQLSDASDNIINRQLLDSEYQFSSKVIYTYFGARRYLQELLKGVHEVMKEDKERASMLQQHYEYLVKKIQKELNCVVTCTPNTRLKSKGYFDIAIAFN
jgi:hypothetical protein